MQLEKIVQFHKALADPTRVKLLMILSAGERSGIELAEKLGISPATVTHHIIKLRNISLINERRNKNTIYFTLNHQFIKNSRMELSDLLYRQEKEVKKQMSGKQKNLEQSVLNNFITSEGKLKQLPAQLKKKLIILERIVSIFEKGQKYPEKEINEALKRFHDDYATLRRELIMHHFMYRENQVYECNPEEMWNDWRTLS